MGTSSWIIQGDFKCSHKRPNKVEEEESRKKRKQHIHRGRDWIDVTMNQRYQQELEAGSRERQEKDSPLSS